MDNRACRWRSRSGDPTACECRRRVCRWQDWVDIAARIARTDRRAGSRPVAARGSHSHLRESPFLTNWRSRRSRTRSRRRTSRALVTARRRPAEHQLAEPAQERFREAAITVIDAVVVQATPRPQLRVCRATENGSSRGQSTSRSVAVATLPHSCCMPLSSEGRQPDRWHSRAVLYRRHQAARTPANA